MTILIAGTLHLPALEREKALAETATLVEETRTQKGCRHYVWSADPAHLAGPYYQNMLASLGKYGVSDTEVSKFKVALEEPVYDPEGKPRADFFTE
jgi:quinol monooxygenase YgiN